MAGNGLGPKWFPEAIRVWLTSLGKLFFDEASWEKHDEGYARGYPSRWECDKGFLKAMLRDARNAKTLLKSLACYLLAWLLWLLVRLFGWTTYNNKGIQ